MAVPVTRASRLVELERRLGALRRACPSVSTPTSPRAVERAGELARGFIEAGRPERVRLVRDEGGGVRLCIRPRPSGVLEVDVLVEPDGSGQVLYGHDCKMGFFGRYPGCFF